MLLYPGSFCPCTEQHSYWTAKVGISFFKGINPAVGLSKIQLTNETSGEKNKIQAIPLIKKSCAVRAFTHRTEKKEKYCRKKYLLQYFLWVISLNMVCVPYLGSFDWNITWQNCQVSVVAARGLFSRNRHSCSWYDWYDSFYDVVSLLWSFYNFSDLFFVAF